MIMDSIYVYNRDFEILGIIDSYESLIWRPSYSDIGDFEIHMPATDKAMELLTENNYVVRSSDISADSNITFKKVMIVKNVVINTEVEKGDFITATGRELKYMLHQRLIWSQTICKGTAEEAIRQYITENAINPTDKNRIIPGLELGELVGFSDTLNKQVTAQPLDETIVDICNTYNYGWDIYVRNKRLIFTLYQGVDRSYEQTERPYVVFSDSYDNLNNTEYHKRTEDFANTALVGGEGEGLERIYATVGNEHTGLDRFETFVEAKDVRRNVGSEDEISLSEYQKLLEEDGKTELAEYGITEAFTGDIVSDMGFVYEEDFFLGDIVTVINKYGISRNVRVISAIESADDTGTRLIPQFNM